MTHREALNVILSKAEGVFHIPADMAEGVIRIAQMAPAMSRELYIQPLPFIQEHYASLRIIGKKMNELRPNFDKAPDPGEDALYQRMMHRYDKMIDNLIIDYNPDAAEAIMQSMIDEFCTD